jgi:hypothetical protein
MLVQALLVKCAESIVIKSRMQQWIGNFLILRFS